jgi:DNA-binding XRE family transcriptional regulator
MSAQIIELNGVPAFAVVPVAEWNALLARLEDLQDIAEGKSAQGAETFPAEFADRLLQGESPLKVWRAYRGLTLQELAEKCGVTRQMLSMIEHGKAKPSSDLLSRLAIALVCDMDDLLASPGLAR